jgi:hypothetical protein
VHGLSIRCDGADQQLGVSQLAWRVTRLDEIVADPATAAGAPVVRDGRAWLPLSFVDEQTGEIVCRWFVRDDGSAVDCEAARWVCAGDLRALLEEPIMRVVLARRGLASVHAAAVVKDGRAVLLMGERGAGKSSLAAALCARGWRPLADDLARVDEAAGVWRAFRGAARVSVNGDTAAVLGYRLTDLATRWSAPIDLEGNKYVPPFEAATCGHAPVAALLFVGRRAAGAGALDAHELSAGEQVARLVANLTPAAPPTPKPGPAAWSAVRGLLRQCETLKLVLPDRLDELGAAAAALDRRLERVLSEASDLADG